MKRRGFEQPGYQRREWEQAGTVYVYATEGVELSNVEKTIETINHLVKEFNLPLQIENGNELKSEDIPRVESLITSNAQENLIDCRSILEELRRYWHEDVLDYGLIVLVNPERYEFKNEPSDQKPAIYGWTHNQGLSVLLRFDIEKAVRHEFGHMVGLGFHHPDCAMDWTCSIHRFCEQCVKDINEIWELADSPACGAGDSIKPGA